MDATFSSHGIFATKGNLLPEAGDVPSLSWVQSVSKQIVRAAGYAGSMSVKLVRCPTEDGFYATASGTLPPGAFGTTIPPAIFAFPQYGSVVVYKHILDYQGEEITPGNYLGYPRGQVFHTSIQNLQTAEDTIDGTVYAFWTFDIYHKALREIPVYRVVAGALIPQYQNVGLIHQWLPLRSNSDALLPVDGITLHWYAIGADPNFS